MTAGTGLVAEESASATRTTKQSLLALSHAMERSLDVGVRTQDRPTAARRSLVLACFQRRRYFEVEQERYARIAEAGVTCVVAFEGSVDGVAPSLHAVPLAPGDPLTGEWSLIVLDGTLGISLVARDLGSYAGRRAVEADRVFDASWSFSPHQSAEEAARVLGALTPHLPHGVRNSAHQVVEGARLARPSVTSRRLAAVTETLVRAVDTAHYRAVTR